jgi:hypothetical protein
MTDRELLELAAKAAGIESLWWTKDGNKLFQRNGGEQKPWNPLLDDGDALRLAVKLSMHMYIFHAADGVGVSYTEVNRNVKERHNNDPYAATRRAIVRAAAALKATP